MTLSEVDGGGVTVVIVEEAGQIHKTFTYICYYSAETLYNINCKVCYGQTRMMRSIAEAATTAVTCVYTYRPVSHMT